MSSRLAAAVWTVIGVIAFSVTGTVVDWLWQGHLVHRSIAAIHEHFPIDMQFADALTRTRHDYPTRYTDITAETCAKDAPITTPRYQPQGGPCIFGIDETGSTWWGFESAVQFRLLFDSGGRLRVVQALPVYTFL